MKTIPLITMDNSSRSLGTFIENFKGIIEFEGYNNKILEDIKHLVVFFEYVGDNDHTFKIFTNFFETYKIPTFLVIDDSYEGLTDDAFLTLVKETVAKNKFIKDWVVLTNNPILDTPNKIYFNVQLHLDRYDGINVNEHIDNVWNGNSNLRKKKFLCLNRQERLHRLLLTDYLLEHDIAKHTYLSCPLGNYKYVIDGELTQPEHRKYLDSNLQTVKLSTAQQQRLKDSLPINLDLEGATYNTLARNLPTAEQFYKESYISIITEGDFYQDRKGFTEKVLKCFLYKHPFIVAGLQDTLTLLREMGFITFNDIINEEYDNVSDPTQRLQQVCKEIKRLNSFNIHEIQDMYNNIQPVLDYNRQHYLKLYQQKQPVELLHRIKNFVSDL
jgi:hypothetical protein